MGGGDGSVHCVWVREDAPPHRTVLSRFWDGSAASEREEWEVPGLPVFVIFYRLPFLGSIAYPFSDPHRGIQLRLGVTWYQRRTCCRYRNGADSLLPFPGGPILCVSGQR